MENQLGTGYVLEADTITDVNTAARGTEANYKPIACLTSNGFDITTAAQSTQNKCDGRYDSSLPGTVSASMTGEGVATKLSELEEADRTNFQGVAELAESGKIFFLRWTDAAGNFVREGKVWISAYGESAPNNEAYTFTATFTITGKFFLVPAVV